MTAQVPAFRLAVGYFLYFCTLGAFVPFAIRLFVAKELSSEMAGVMVSVVMGAQLVAPLMLAKIADAGINKLTIMRWALLLQVLMIGSMAFIDQIWLLMLVGFLFGIPLSAVLPQLEALTLDALQGNEAHYGKIRMWGSFGFLVTTLVTGWLIDATNVNVIYAVIALVSSLFIGLTFTLPAPQTSEDSSAEVPAKLWQAIWQWHIVLLLMVAFLWQVGFSVFNSWFDPWLIQNDYSPQATGRWMAFAVLCEMLMLPFLARNHRTDIILWLLPLALILTAFRWWGIYYWIDSPLMITLLMPIHALSFGAVHLCFLFLFSRLFTRKLQVQAQALYVTVAMGAGIVLGNQFASALMLVTESIGANFILASMVTALAAVIALSFARVMRRIA